MKFLQVEVTAANLTQIAVIARKVKKAKKAKKANARATATARVGLTAIATSL